jgi:hypothetical protein
VALADIDAARTSAEALPPAAASDHELVAERVLLGIIAVLAVMLVPGHTHRLIDTPLTWGELARALHHGKD